MKNILFKTSKGIAKAVIVESNDDLLVLKDNASLFHETESYNNFLFHSPPYSFFRHSNWQDVFVMLYKESIYLFEDCHFEYFFFEDGWVKMKLDDPYYGCPEWEPILIADYPFIFNDIEQGVKGKDAVLVLFDD